MSIASYIAELEEALSKAHDLIAVLPSLDTVDWEKVKAGDRAEIAKAFNVIVTDITELYPPAAVLKPLVPVIDLAIDYGQPGNVDTTANQAQTGMQGS